MSAQEYAFLVFAVIGGLSAIAVVTARNVVHAALYLVVSLLSVAGVYLLLGAEFLGARCRHDALGRLEEERIVEQAPEPAKPVADRRRRQAKTIGSTSDMALLEHHVEQDEEVQVDAG